MKNSTMLMKIACAILFLIFTFCFLYYYQADILTVEQHVLSHGQTRYDRTIGAVLITLLLYLLQLGVYSLTKFERYAHAATYFPSLLFLATITNVNTDIDQGLSLGVWLWLLPLLLALYGLWAFQSKKCPRHNSEVHSPGLLFRMIWTNVLLLALMFFLVGLVSNHNDVFHYRMRAENALLHDDFKEASSVGQNSQATDSSLTMIRAYALGRQGLLGERFFRYSQEGTSKVLLPDGVTTKLLLYPESRFYRSLGAVPLSWKDPMACLEFVCKHHLGTRMAADYLLIGYLLDRRLDAFAHAIVQYYDVSKALPMHYCEALVLYNHMRSAPYVEYHHDVVEADYKDFMKLFRSEKQQAARLAVVKKTFGNTYWYYYFKR